MDVYRIIKPVSIGFIFFGALVMLGWVVGIPLLKAPIPWAPMMKFTTALSIALGGGLLRAFYHIAHEEKQEASMLKIMLCGCVLFLVFFPLMIGYFFDIDTGFVVLTFSPTDRDPVPSIGTITCIGTLFLLAFFSRVGVSISKASRWGGIALMGVSGLALLGYAIGDPTLYYLTKYSTGMAIHTASSYLLLGFFFFMLGMRPHFPAPTEKTEDRPHAYPA